jgi:hypothetical protein
MLLEVAKKWDSLGCYTIACKVVKEYGRIKLHKNSISITQDILNGIDKIPEDYNFLALDLRKSGIVCLDIENNPNSVSEFCDFLVKNGRNISEFFYEASLNGGIHIYFRSKNQNFERNRYDVRRNHIVFDVLYTGKAFLYPSKLGNKRYEAQTTSIYTIQTINDVEIIPKFIDDFIKDIKTQW